jgi:hypothetical protein
LECEFERNGIGLRPVVVVLLIGALLGSSLRTIAQNDFAGKTPSAQGVAVEENADREASSFDVKGRNDTKEMFKQGQEIFRFDTFGDEAFWGDTLQLHKAIAGAKLGGVGPGVSARMALAVGLKVDVGALPPELIQALKSGKVNVDDPATTVALLKLNAVIGVTGVFNAKGALSSMGIQCAFCHSTVDDSLAPGIGHRLDGWANRDLNVGAIVALAPHLEPIADLLKVDVPTVKEEGAEQLGSRAF